MFQLTRRVDYALLALAHLARSSGALATVREIAELYGVPQTLLAQILRVLARAELLVSVRGSKGGYRLNRPAEEISIAELMDCLDMPVQILCCAGETDSCQISTTCLIRDAVQTLQTKIERVFRETSIAEIAGVGSESSEGTACLPTHTCAPAHTGQKERS